jgi:serine phosphatase RsbU (regulator of sigma subunit)
LLADEIPFESIKYAKDDYFYFFSDGITDQFGGPDSKKLMKKRLIEFLDNSISLSSLEREIELDLFLRKWQNNTEQTDDMIFIGISPNKLNPKYHIQNSI